jgi:hypothetical protein
MMAGMLPFSCFPAEAGIQIRPLNWAPAFAGERRRDGVGE